MTVQELIDLLLKCDPNAKVLVDQGLCKPVRVIPFNGRTDTVLITNA